MKNIKKDEAKVKIDLKIADEFLDLKSLETNVIIKKLEDQIKLRETKIEKHVEKDLKKT